MFQFMLAIYWMRIEIKNQMSNDEKMLIHLHTNASNYRMSSSLMGGLMLRKCDECKKQLSHLLCDGAFP